MITIFCPACKEEKNKYEIVNISPSQRKYEVRCPDCGKTFVVYGQDMEKQPPVPPDQEEKPKS